MLKHINKRTSEILEIKTVETKTIETETVEETKQLKKQLGWKRGETNLEIKVNVQQTT